MPKFKFKKGDVVRLFYGRVSAAMRARLPKGEIINGRTYITGVVEGLVGFKNHGRIPVYLIDVEGQEELWHRQENYLEFALSITDVWKGWINA